MFYTSDNMPEFVGIAERGRPTSEAGWLIVKISYDSNNNISTVLSAKRNSILDNRASLSYK